MSYWMWFFGLIIVFLIVMEESIYYLWNRYVYGPNHERINRWKHRTNKVIHLFKRKHKEGGRETNQEKSSI
jgi:hypothetical protein